MDECGSAANKTVTILSFLHIVFQPFLINAFAMEHVPETVKRRVRVWIFAICGLSTATLLVRLLPIDWAGLCRPTSPLCGGAWCTRAGEWHIAWDVPYNGLVVPLEAVIGLYSGFPTYMFAAFVLPLAYGAWRCVIFHVLAGPILASMLTSDPNERPAVWCLLSIGIVLMGLSPLLRRQFSAESWWGREIPAI